ncbi:hypothetical protein BWZ22_09065 [Seonamhaeicola sp. S2-3]|uniref:hypothetical protein n=1 Tax=Seonamhaeicola sp. S2-3 TaxID=1936081 RepID=UPI0009727B1A|nr:hypothetical protein [Seonamhaeicola sp. S2-3]APY11384.1 hypothetical protein BWZ22_09065 [Seonamhaeicola sp. S2-3]
MKKIAYIILVLFMVSCYSDDNVPLVADEEAILSTFIANKKFIKDNVIACAASDEVSAGLINVYFYPEAGAKDFKLYQSDGTDGNDFSKYQFVKAVAQPFIDGTLQQFKVRSKVNWFVVVYMVDDTVKISTPIRSKVFSQPTVWNNAVTINQEQMEMPQFNWPIADESLNAIFFQVVTTQNSEFLSGTYTHENKFQYYKLNNVVLNVTNGTPPNLVSNNTYNFIVMDVSLDNWVNTVSSSSFVAN